MENISIQQQKMGIENGDNFSVDYVLSEVGEFGLFQVYTFLLLSMLKMSASFSVVNYMISANTLDHR